MSLRINTTNYRRQVQRLMDIRRWPNVQKFWAGQAKGVMKEVIAYVPPSKGKATLEGKRRGEEAVASDIAKLFIGVTPRRAKETDIKSLHQRHRNAKGRVGRDLGQNRYKVPRAALNAYIRETKKSVGYLAGGFNAAAARVGYRPPAWIWRHQSPGSVVLRISDRGIRFRATNAVDYASQIGVLERRIQKGINAQAAKIERETRHLLIRAARGAGFKTRG